MVNDRHREKLEDRRDARLLEEEEESSLPSSANLAGFPGGTVSEAVAAAVKSKR